MKRQISLIIAVVLLLTLFSGCGKKETVDPMDGVKETLVPIEGVDGGMLVKEKKYEYDGKNVMLLNVENQTDADYTVTINGKYLDAEGNEIKSMSQTFDGFPAGYKNYFLFKPGITFDSFSYEMTATPHSGTAFAKYLTSDSNVKFAPVPSNLDENNEVQDEVYTELEFEFPFNNSYTDTLYFEAAFIVFDKNGRIYYIDDKFSGGIISPSSGSISKTRFIRLYDTPWGEYQMPDELDGDLTGITCFTKVSDK